MIHELKTYLLRCDVSGCSRQERVHAVSSEREALSVLGWITEAEQRCCERCGLETIHVCPACQAKRNKE